MKKVVKSVLIALLCITTCACNNRRDDFSIYPDESGTILSLPKLIKIGSYNIEGASLIPIKGRDTYMLNVCLKSGSNFDYEDTVIRIKIGSIEITLNQMINNSTWAMYSCSDIKYTTEIKIMITDKSGTTSGTVFLDKSRHELYESVSSTPVYGICAKAYSLSRNGNLVFLTFHNDSENALVDYFINNFDLISTGAQMFYVDVNGAETAITEMGGLLDIHPFTGNKCSYLILRPATMSDVVKIRVKLIYINKNNLSHKTKTEFESILANSTTDVTVTENENSYVVSFKVPLDIPVIF